MSHRWSSLLHSFHVDLKKKLELFSFYLQKQEFQDNSFIFLHNVEKYILKDNHPELIIIACNVDIIVEHAITNDINRLTIIVLDEVKVKVFIQHNPLKIDYQFFVGPSAQLNLFFSFIDDKECTSKVSCHLVGVDAQVSLQISYMLNQAQNVSLLTEQHHHAPHTKSDLLLRGFITDKAQIMHQGIITIDKKAQQTVASQHNKTLIGSLYAKAKSMPNLEINAHDVRCAHGSAIGYLDEQQLFYLQSRGFDVQESQKILIKAFFAELNDCLHEAVKEKLNTIMQQ